jgi:hypothetical protein
MLLMESHDKKKEAIQALIDRPGTPGEKEAAIAAMKRYEEAHPVLSQPPPQVRVFQFHTIIFPTAPGPPGYVFYQGNWWSPLEFAVHFDKIEAKFKKGL